MCCYDTIFLNVAAYVITGYVWVCACVRACSAEKTGTGSCLLFTPDQCITHKHTHTHT